MVNPKFLNPDKTEKNDIEDDTENVEIIKTNTYDDNNLYSFYNSNLGDYIVPKNEILKECKINQAVSIVLKHAKCIPKLHDKMHDIEFMVIICTYIENLGIMKGDVSKKLIFEAVYKEIFNVSEVDLTQIMLTVNFLLKNKLVKKIKIRKRVIRFLKLNFMPVFLY